VSVKFRYPLPPLPKGQQSSPVLSKVSGHPCTVCSLWSSLCCPQSLVIPVLSAVSGHPCTVSTVSGHPCTVSAVSGHPCTVSAVSGHLLYCVRSLWSSPVLCPQPLVIPYTMSAVSSHPLYYPKSLVIPVLSAVSGHPCAVRSLWSSLCCPQSLVIPVLCPQSLVIPVLCPQSLVIPVLCPQSLVISCTVSAVSGHLLYCVRSLWSSP
ncbi:unnamed protein product, partial [Staurois parvus]